MDKSLDFSAKKYSGAGDEDALRLDQLKSSDGFDASDLEMFNPIRAHEVFEIEISSDLDPLKVIEHLRFSDEDSPDFYSSDEYPVDWLEEIGFETSHRFVSRYAVLIQGDQLWKIAGVRFDEELKLVLQDPEDSYSPSTRYYSQRVLGDFEYHSEGPGPVSWDGSCALVDIGGFWILANGGDISEPDDVITPDLDAFGFATYYIAWLQENLAQVAFILNRVKCEWADREQKQQFEALLDGVREVALFSDQLSAYEVDLVIEHILNSGYEFKELINVLRSPKHALAPALLKVMSQVVKTESAQVLRSRDGLISYLRSF